MKGFLRLASGAPFLQEDKTGEFLGRGTGSIFAKATVSIDRNHPNGPTGVIAIELGKDHEPEHDAATIRHMARLINLQEGK
jgi:hypothetical protein